jgi:7-carboxy-7-deazaguanine synthase
VKAAKESRSTIAVVTGGEPLMYNLDELTALLKTNGFRTHIETSGAHPVTGNWDWFCLSPKKFKKPLREAFEVADELKVIVYNRHDFKWAESMASKIKNGCKMFLQPEWSKSQEMLPEIISFVKNHPHWEISLQLHKFMDIP